jgi:hypothetical protein
LEPLEVSAQRVWIVALVTLDAIRRGHLTLVCETE